MRNNLTKNRYTDVLCYDHSRVVLSQDSEDSSDYINANFVDGYKQKNAYISTQGEYILSIQWCFTTAYSVFLSVRDLSWENLLDLCLFLFIIKNVFFRFIAYLL